MAKRKSINRKGSRSAPRIVNGHELSPAMYSAFRVARRNRAITNGTYPAAVQEQMALGDVIARFMPSRHAAAQLTDVLDRAHNVGMAIEHVRKFPFIMEARGPVRAAGLTILRQLAAELRALADKAQAVTDAIEAEGGEKLQDWQRRNRAIEALALQPAIREAA